MNLFIITLITIGVLAMVATAALVLDNVKGTRSTKMFLASCLVAIAVTSIAIPISFIVRFHAENEYRKNFARLLSSNSLVDILMKPDRLYIKMKDSNTEKWYEIRFLSIIECNFKVELDIPVVYVTNGKLTKISIPLNLQNEWHGYELSVSR